MTEELQEKLYDHLRAGQAFHGLQLVGVEIQGGRQNLLVRIYVDKLGGVDVDVCAEVSRRVDIDVESFLAEQGHEGTFVLEVSSPGLDRPLFFREDYALCMGKMVDVRTKAPVNGRKHFKGMLKSYQSEADVVEIEDGEALHRIDYRNIKKGHLDFFAMAKSK